MTFQWWPGVLDGAVCTSYPLVPVRVSSPGQLSREPRETADKGLCSPNTGNKRLKEVWYQTASPGSPLIPLNLAAMF